MTDITLNRQLLYPDIAALVMALFALVLPELRLEFLWITAILVTPRPFYDIIMTLRSGSAKRGIMSGLLFLLCWFCLHLEFSGKLPVFGLAASISLLTVRVAIYYRLHPIA